MILISTSTISILISTTPSQHVIILLPPRFGCLRSCPPCSAGHAAFFCSFVSHVISLLFSKQVTVRGCQCFLRVSALLRDSACAFRPACHPLSPLRPPCLPSVSGLAFLLVTVSALSLVCLLVSTLSPSCLPLSRVLSPFLLVTVSGLSPFCLLLFLFLSLYDCNTVVESWETNGNEGRGSTEVKGAQLWVAVSASALQSFACVSQLWTALSASRLQSFTCVSSSGLLCPPCLGIDCCIHLCLAILNFTRVTSS